MFILVFQNYLEILEAGFTVMPQEPQRIPATGGGARPVHSYTFIPVTELKLEIGYSKGLAIVKLNSDNRPL